MNGHHLVLSVEFALINKLSLLDLLERYAFSDASMKKQTLSRRFGGSKVP